MERFIQPAVRAIPPSGIRKYFDFAEDNAGAISLSVGEPDYITPANVMEAGIRSLREGMTHYSPNAGFRELRVEINKYMKDSIGVDYNPDSQILVTVGGSEAIDVSLRVLAGVGDEVIIPEPSFVAYTPCAKLTGADVVTIPVRSEDGFKLKAEDVAKAITPRTKVLLLPFPNNPTGAILERSDLEAIAEVIRDKDIFVITDEVYAELVYDGHKHVSMASIDGMADKTIVINGFSKAYAMTGWRIGFACGHPDIIGAMLKVHQYAIMCPPTIAQFAAIEGMRNSNGQVAEMRNDYQHRRDIIVQGFRDAGLTCYEPKGAFYVFPDITSTGMTSEQFCDGLLNEEKVAIVPGTAFGACGEGYARACYAYAIDSIVEAMKRVKRFVDNHR